MLGTETSPQRSRRGRQLESARDFVARLCAGFPSDSPEQIAERYLSHVRENNLFDDAQQQIYVLDPLREWVLAIIGAQARKAAKYSPEARERRRAQRAALVKTIETKVEQKIEDKAEELVEIRLLQYQTTYGKPLGQCTGAECRRLGKRYGEFFTEVSKRLRPSEHVESHLSELELQAIARVHFLIGPSAGNR
jgi:hypothetical protein